MTDRRQTTGGTNSTAPSMSISSGKENSIPDSSTTTATATASHAPVHNKSPNRRARKALHATWSTPGNIQVPGIGCDSISFLPETPVSISILSCTVFQLVFIYFICIFRANLLLGILPSCSRRLLSSAKPCRTLRKVKEPMDTLLIVTTAA